MPTIRLEIDPKFLGPMSVGTVSVIRTLAQDLGLSLKEAKETVDECVFEGRPSTLHVNSVAAGLVLCEKLSRLGAPAVVRATLKLPDPSEVRQPESPGGNTRLTFVAPDIVALEESIRDTFPELSPLQTEQVLSHLGKVLYAPRRYLDAYHSGLITAPELQNKLLAEIHSEVWGRIGRYVEVSELAHIEERVERMLFPLGQG